MKKVVVIDGQGGRMGALVVEKLKQTRISAEIVAVGTNSIATATMMKAGANAGATGENPVIVNCRDADAIIGPLGILAADSFHGEVTAAMAVAVGQSPAVKLLLPVSRCNLVSVGAEAMSQGEMVQKAVDHLLQIWNPGPISIAL